MIGTLIGMVQMFANMTDPSKLGPFMAVALLATLYGALSRTCSACRSPTSCTSSCVDEEVSRSLMIDGILMIRDSKSPRWCARCCSLICRKIIGMRTVRPFRPDGHEYHGRRKRQARHGGGGHGWFVTFADLMGLLMSFFVMLVAFSKSGSGKAAGGRGFDARCLRGAEQRALFGHCRSRRIADPSQA